jgi:DNA invertase Pin-like site-specific DNA recombinase
MVVAMEGSAMMNAAKRIRNVGIYLRVSTGDQTTRNQRRELREVAQRHGWNVVKYFEDAGISGAKGRGHRPGFDAMLKAIARREIDMVAAWSVDRLGRSLKDLIDFLGDLKAKRCDLYLHQQGLDTSTPSGEATFGMLGIFAQFERAMIQERVKTGLQRAKAEGKQLGRRQGSRGKKVLKLEAKAQKELAKGTGIAKTARLVGLGVGTVHRIKREMTCAR